VFIKEIEVFIKLLSASTYFYSDLEIIIIANLVCLLSVQVASSNNISAFSVEVDATYGTVNGFNQLVREIKEQLDGGGISSANVDVNRLVRAMEKYKSVPEEWEEYKKPNLSKNYTRTVVDNCNENANLLILCWSPGKSSPIHDHANAHCVMKVLKGELTEILYDWPEDSGKEEPLHVKSFRTLGHDAVTYMHDKLGLHKIGNPSTDDIAVSVHLYTPPWAAKYGCQIFDEKTGKASHIEMSYI